MNPGDRREAIFADDDDRRRFLTTLGKAAGKTGWQVQADCVRTNHFHLVVETPQPNLVAGMKWFPGAYTTRFNRRHQGFGHVFSGRDKALLVDGGGTGDLKTVGDYVHLNPVRAGLVAAGHPLESFQWSGYAEYLRSPGHRPPWLRVDRLLGKWRIPQDSPTGRRRFGRFMEQRRAREDAPGGWQVVERGRSLGDPASKGELLAQVHEKRGHHHGADLREADELHAEGVVRAELGRLGWAEAELERRRKGDADKVEMAGRLRRGRAMTSKWIARRLRMGAWTSVSNRLSREGTLVWMRMTDPSTLVWAARAG